MDKPLTDAARANIEAGNTEGPGTPTCRKCGGPKEPTRLNSSQCRRCQNEVQSERRATKRLVRTEVDADVFAALAALAEAKGMDLDAYVRHGLHRLVKVDSLKSRTVTRLDPTKRP